jgi:iron complex outermembrane recepter protein
VQRLRRPSCGRYAQAPCDYEALAGSGRDARRLSGPARAQATAYVGGGIRYLSDQVGDYDLDYRTDNGRQREIPSYEVLDLQAGVDFGRYTIELYAKNVTDSDGKTSVGSLGATPNGAIGTGVIRPRTIGLTLGVGF